MLPCAMPPRGADDAFSYFPQVNPIAAQFQRPGVNTGDRQKIANHFIKIFGFFLDLSEQVFLYAPDQACHRSR